MSTPVVPSGGLFSATADVRRRISLTPTQKVWLLTVLITVVAAGLIERCIGAKGLEAPLRLPLAGLIAAFYLTELAVVHLEFGRHAHSFSMSEFALVLGLFFASPLDLILANVIANALVLTIHRRQPLLKLAFNLSQFALQTSVAVSVFALYSNLGDPLGPAGWAGALLAVLAALLLADLLINAAIRLTGGRIGIDEMLEVFGMSSVAAMLNTTMALVAVVVLWQRPGAVWLAVIPPLALFMAYHGYMSQRVQRSRFKALYEATRELHGAPQIERALASAATSTLSMLNAERVEIYLLDRETGMPAVVTAAGPGDERTVMEPIATTLATPWRTALDAGQTLRIETESEGGGIAAPLLATDGAELGVVFVANRLGNVAGFKNADLETLETFAAQIAVSVSNSHLAESLARADALAVEQESLIRAKDEFIASVSHELRTPLTTVMGLSQELVSPATTFEQEERDELTALIAEQSMELAHLVDDLLVSARADIGTLDLAQQETDISAEVASVLREVRGGDVIEMRGETGLVWADGLRVRQIVRNLVSNAYRYGGDAVRIELTQSGSRVTLAVVDNGPGVPASEEATIFEAYGSAHEPGTQPASIGLGLHVARRLAQQMGGDLVYRRVDDETHFELTLRSVA